MHRSQYARDLRRSGDDGDYSVTIRKFSGQTTSTPVKVTSNSSNPLLLRRSPGYGRSRLQHWRDGDRRIAYLPISG